MVKKLKAQAQHDDKLFADAVRISAQQIWQAGLGAFAKAQQGGKGKDEAEGGAGHLFDTLVAEGTQMQQRGGPPSEDGAGTLARHADGAGERAAGTWDKLEQVFEERVGRALAAIGVPSRADLEALTRQVEQLARMVEQLGGAQGAAGKVAASAKRAAKKTAAPRKPAANKAGAAPGAGD